MERGAFCVDRLWAVEAISHAARMNGSAMQRLRNEAATNSAQQAQQHHQDERKSFASPPRAVPLAAQFAPRLAETAVERDGIVFDRRRRGEQKETCLLALFCSSRRYRYFFVIFPPRFSAAPPAGEGKRENSSNFRKHRNST